MHEFRVHRGGDVIVKSGTQSGSLAGRRAEALRDESIEPL